MQIDLHISPRVLMNCYQVGLVPCLEQKQGIENNSSCRNVYSGTLIL